MEVVNDVQLLELVREPAKELLPSARRSSVVQPLLVLLAFVPGLFGFWNRSLDEATCQQGLLAFDVTTGERPIDWVVTASRDEAPLPMLLTALGLKVELLSPESRLLLVSYLSSVLLLLCLGSLAKRIGGSRFALLAVCLACGHREFLTLSESLPPVALALTLAVLSFRALLVHQTSDNSLMSRALITSGLALGACCLAGTQVALVSWYVLLVVSMLSVFTKKESSARWTLERAVRYRLSNFTAALFSVLVVTVIAVSVVAGWQSAFMKGINLRTLGESTAWFRQAPPFASQSRTMFEVILPTFGAWLGFSLLGAVQIARGRMKFLDGAGRRGLWFWAGWSVVATISTWMTWPLEQGDRTSSLACVGFFLLPMLLLAASGLEGVLRREFELGWVVAATLVTIGVVFAPTWMNWRLPSLTGSRFVAMTLFGGLVIGGLWFVLRQAGKSESLSRVALFACVTLLVLLDISEGILSRPPLANDERELLAFRRQLMNETPPKECWLLTKESSPARLQFLLRSLWHDVTLREASDWDTLVATSRHAASSSPATSNVSPTDSSKTHAIVVTWGNPELPASELKRRSQSLSQTTTPHYLQGRPLKGYRWILRPEGLSSR